ncbi:MAG: S41 family peptidase [Ignavibacteriae bacterium]|nr:S41 family peptidase [Ignavibacteriota bacterium]
MNKKIKYGNFAPLLIIVLLFSSFLLGTSYKRQTDIYDRINKNMDVLGKVYREIAINYVDAIDVDKFFRFGIDGMLGTLDPYTVYYDDKNRDAIDLITTGKYGGIGVTIEMKDSAVRITDIMNGYEAQRKGMRIGDMILSIDNTDIKGFQLEKVRQLVRGTPETKLMIKVQRDSEIIDFELTRQEIILKNISYSGYIGDETEGIAYIKLDRFTSNSESEMETALKKFKLKNNLNGLIIDLRNNGGGLLDAAIGILSKLTEKNSFLLTTRGNSKESEKKFFSKETPLIPGDVPIVILINQNTASASEIVAGAIQDLDRGVIVGSKSFGKGLVQQIKELGNDSRLKLTTSRYFTPSGRWIQEKNYFKENKSGVFLNNESFQQTEFKTLNGRIVYANGGITPDVVIKLESISEIHTALMLKDMFFKFAVYYLENHPGIKIFRCTDNIFNDFKNFVNSRSFIYKSEADKKLDELRQTGEKKEYSSSYFESIEKLEKEINREKSKEFESAKEELQRSIEAEINKMIITESEQIEASFDTDKQLQEAIKILKDKALYNKILGNL